MKITFLSSLFIFSLLFISCSDSDDSDNEIEEQIDVEEVVSSYTDILFNLSDSDIEDPQYLFSTSEGVSYKESEISDANIALIDIVSFSLKSFVAFDSPDNDTNDIFNIDGASTTKFQHTNVTLTAEEFDSIKTTDSSLLVGLTVTNDEDSISVSDYENAIILFENAAGKKGAIKVTSFNAQRILVDIKVTK